MSRCCDHLLESATYGLYDETPIKVHVSVEEGMVALLLGPYEQLRLEFMDPDPLDRFVRAAKEARRCSGGSSTVPVIIRRAVPWTSSCTSC
jgi:hypothetical protein